MSQDCSDTAQLREASTAAEGWPDQVEIICRLAGPKCGHALWLKTLILFKDLHESVSRFAAILIESKADFNIVSCGAVMTPGEWYPSAHSAAVGYSQRFLFHVRTQFWLVAVEAAGKRNIAAPSPDDAFPFMDRIEEEPNAFLAVAIGQFRNWWKPGQFDPSEIRAKLVLERTKLLGSVPSAEEPSGPLPDFAVDLQLLRVSIGVVQYSVSEMVAHYLYVLNKHRGTVMSDGEVAKASAFLLAAQNGSRPRFDAVRDAIPHPEVLAWIEKVPHKGSKLRPPTA